MLKALFRNSMKLLCGVFFRLRIKGDFSVFHNPRTLIVANHESFIDGILLAAHLPIDATFVVHTTVANNWFFRLFLSLTDYLAVDPTNPLAIKAVVRLLEAGKPVVIFPEGRITTTGSLMKVYDGAAFAAARTGATIVPVRISGASRTFFSRLGGIYPRTLFPKISLQVLGRRAIAMPELPSAKARRRKAGQLMRDILLEMLVATRPERTLYRAYLDAQQAFGRQFSVVEDISQNEESYGSLTQKIIGLARIVNQISQAKDTIGVLLPNTTPTLALLFALSARARIPAMLNYSAGRDGILAACIAAQIKTIVTSRAFIAKGKLDALIEQLPGIEVLYLEDLRSRLGLGDKLMIVLAQLLPSSIAIEQAPNDAAVILFTSGSEGKPKGVVHSHNSLLANVAQIRALADFTPRDKFMVALPLFHSFGLTACALLPLVTGIPVFLYPSPLHYRIIPEIVYDRGCSVLFGTSTFLGNYAKFAHPYDFGRLRYVVAGAEKLNETVRRNYIEQFGIRILEGYGVTECAPVVAVNVPMASKIGTVGQLAPGMKLKLIPVAGVPEGGQLWVSGPNVMKGYLRYENPGQLEVLPSEDGITWYDTGDIVKLDADGFISIQGRAKRFAKIAGEMVSLEVVEQIARQAAPDFMHASSARADDAKGEALVLFTTHAELSRDNLLAAARELGAAELAVPRDIRHVAAIPLLGTGKTDYLTLKSWASDS
ncbi:bifunctional acyl-ACP--phospholipid O-acyltransferase/long-chain-fatty-acid--ACP ligase [Chitinibacter bivalviorum]|uniref:Bifunctional acyl-ACP--phospholipid O-acyltransferase/long-chain-fatty-acid--ACP ligase n=2 Tax=Chitinibacter bivalviorum TaxID=2739434 RepID=A0A7H9BNY3_9NEIS|nr:bifunctional acyl-ACP--phospholipid O-acyltransferase/long-chain-fatty-acid--ACP ligase [Chitinibacter bivalviorum]